MRFSGINRRGAAALAFCSLLLFIASRPCAAQTETVLYTFCSQPNCVDGAQPEASLVMDKDGNLYGTTVGGGANNFGTVFKLSPSGTEMVLYSFCAEAYCTDGAYPASELIIDKAGNLYGTTPNGGAHGYGMVYKLSPGGTETVLYSFCADRDCPDGEYPSGPVVMDRKGNLYGTTFNGGNQDSSDGTVFKISPSGIGTVLYSFCLDRWTCTDGGEPKGGVIRDKKGHLYGISTGGYGSLFEVSRKRHESVLYNFADGDYPNGQLIMDEEGNFYGTTFSGGANGDGKVFQVSPGGTETVLHTFAGLDGERPEAGVVMDSDGNLYGTTYHGGANGAGTVFELSPGGTETVLYSFCPGATCADGAYPIAGVIIDSKGVLYGTTYGGGQFVENQGAGVVFKVTP